MPDNEAPGVAAPIVVTSAAPTTAPRFRWGIIPATFSWVMGGCMALGVPISIVAMALSLPEIADSKRFASFIGSFVIQLFALSILAAAWIWAGFRWMSGRWRSALALNLVWGVLYAIQMIAKAAGLFPFE